MHTSPFRYPTMCDNKLVSPPHISLLLRYMLSISLPRKTCCSPHSLQIHATPFCYPNDTYCPIHYLTVHAVPYRYMMLLLMPYLVNLRCMLSIVLPNDTFVLNFVALRCILAPFAYLAIHAAQLVTPRNMLQNLVIPRYMLPISLPLDTFYSISLPQDIYMLMKLDMQRNQPAAQIAVRHTTSFLRWHHESDESDGPGGN